MIYREKPHFIIKKNLQKSKQTGIYFSDIVTPSILKDVCYRITNQKEFTYQYVKMIILMNLFQSPIIKVDWQLCNLKMM